MNQTIYLDYNATTPCDSRVVKSMESTWNENFGNTASQLHSYGWRAESAVEKARSQISSLIDCKPNEITFTSGATEANNWVIFGLFTKLREQNPNEKIHYLASTIEHSSVMNSLKAIHKLFAVEVDFVEVTSTGELDLEDLEKKIQPHTKLLSIIHINNEIGTIQDLDKIVQICHAKNILVHTDATQTIGKYPFSATKSNVDYLTCSAHKFYGPKGVGFLYKKKTAFELNPIFFGGGHEKGRRSGTLNVSAIVGAGAAAEIANEEMSLDFNHISKLKDSFYNQLKAKVRNIKINGPEISNFDMLSMASIKNSSRAYNNLNVCFYPIKTESVIQSLGRIAFSPGSACQSENMNISHVLKGIGCSDLEAQCSIRFSLGRWTTQDEVDQAVELLASVYNNEDHLKRAQAVL